MNKDIKEPLSVLSTFDNHDILPVNVRQIKTPHEESKHVKSFCDYYNQNSCYNLTDSIYHLLMIGKLSCVYVAMPQQLYIV